MKQKINFAAIAVVVVLFVLVVFQGIVICQLQGAVDDSQGYIDYWRLKADSLSDANHQLYMQWFDMRDSLVTIKYKLDHPCPPPPTKTETKIKNSEQR